MIVFENKLNYYYKTTDSRELVFYSTYTGTYKDPDGIHKKLRMRIDINYLRWGNSSTDYDYVIRGAAGTRRDVELAESQTKKHVSLFVFCYCDILELGLKFIRAQICKRLKSLGVDSKESIPTAYVGWRALYTSTGAVGLTRQAGNRFLAP
jgi:hypothetical protein